MRPHYSQSNRENATPSSGTSPLASYMEVPPPPPPGHVTGVMSLNFIAGKLNRFFYLDKC